MQHSFDRPSLPITTLDKHEAARRRPKALCHATSSTACQTERPRLLPRILVSSEQIMIKPPIFYSTIEGMPRSDRCPLEK